MFAVFAMVSAVSAVSATSAVFRQSSANGDGEGENDRQEGFHGTRVFVTVRSRAFIRLVPSPMRTPEQSRGVLIALRDARQYW